MAEFGSFHAHSVRSCGGPEAFAQLVAYFEDEHPRPESNPLKGHNTMTTEPRPLDSNTEEPGSDLLDPSQATNPLMDISSAIRSVAAMGMWTFGKTSVVPKLFSTPGNEESELSSFPPVDKDTKKEEPEHTVEDEDEEPSVTFQSKYINIFPLYQDYCVEAVRGDLQRLNLKTSLSELIAPQYLQALQCRLRPLCPPQETSPSPPERPAIRVAPCTLWQDLDEVKAAGLLSSLTAQQIRLQESMFELIGSEASYLKSLGIAVDHFSSSQALKDTMARMEHHTLFSNIRRVKASSEKFLMDLEHRLSENLFISRIGDVVINHCPAFRTHYVPYITNMMYQEALINQLLQQNRGFVSSLKQLEDEPVCQRQNLKSFLVLPFQRITRIKLILENILKLMEADSDEVLDLKKAREAINEIVIECNDGVKKMKVIEQLVSLEMMLDFGKLKAVPLVISGRFLVHQGPLSLLTVECGPNPKTSLTDIQLHLFNDLLILSSKKEERFLVEDHAEFPTFVHVAPLKAKALGLPPQSFLLHFSRSGTGHSTAMILVAHSRSDKEQWMRVLKCGD
ncbi:rho guanine nucleotide exchange factor 19 [Corythoichthys intestinalis]|uniref:rho guanine nucleotide exchange factor 19 n=1 Tax=Corythoichthys intestinalis TaxID=161448 RepID=UPI0025A58039|nr:rho guanine nucleotide exchange factor 19 [Corythoichthys intestinalis]